MELHKNMVKFHPLGRMSEAMEIAKVIAFLASGEASFVTGATWPLKVVIRRS